MMQLLLACQLVLAVVLLLAATGKVLSSHQFWATLRLSHLPDVFVPPAGVLTPTVELFLAVSLLLSPTHLLAFAFGATFALLCLFTAWMLWVYRRGLRLRCSCFGAGGAEIGLHTILRNLLLTIVSLSGFLLALYTHSPLPGPSLWMMITVLSLAACLMLLYAFHQAREAMALTFADRERLDQEQLRAHAEAEAPVPG